MDDIGIVDHFLNVFIRYIDSGFGLLRGDVSFLTGVLVTIDLTLAGLFWAMGGATDVIGALLKKILYVGAFALIIGNFQELSTIVFRSFAGLGLVASGSTLTEGELLRPGRLAGVGIDAARPIIDQIKNIAGFPQVFANIDKIIVLLFAWLVVIISFFILAVQLFVTLIEFKLSTLAGFVLIPFALWGRTTFLAEKVIGNVVSSGIKVLVLAVIVGIGSGLFNEFTTPPGADFTIDHALSIVLASLCLFGLGLWGPSVATGLVSGAPQLGAGAAANTGLALGGIAVAGAAATAGTMGLAAGLGGGAVKAATAGYQAFKAGAEQSGVTGAASIGPGVSNMARTGASAFAQRAREAFSRFSGASPASSAAETNEPPGWARRMQKRQNISQGLSAAAHVMRSADRGGGGAGPSLRGD